MSQKGKEGREVRGREVDDEKKRVHCDIEEEKECVRVFPYAHASLSRSLLTQDKLNWGKRRAREKEAEEKQDRASSVTLFLFS